MKLVNVTLLALFGASCAASPPARSPRARTPHQTAPETAAAAPLMPAPEVKPPAARPRLTFAEARIAADAALRTFARATWSEATEPGASAVFALSDLIAASGGCPAGPALGAHVAEMRAEAEALLGTDTLGFGKPGRIKRSLMAALDAAVQAGPRPTTVTSPWIDAARSSAAGIDDDAVLAFARAPLQDAFRATFDAVLMTCDPIAAPPTPIAAR